VFGRAVKVFNEGEIIVGALIIAPHTREMIAEEALSQIEAEN
jgi:hypothetical protein